MWNTVFLYRIWFWIRYLYFVYLSDPTYATVIMLGPYPIGTIGPGRYDMMEMQLLVSVDLSCLFRCSGFGVGAVRESFFMCVRR